MVRTMKSKVCFLAVFFLLFFYARAGQAQNGQFEFLRTFLPGTYTLIGRTAEGGEPYQGRVTIALVNDSLRMIRKVQGRPTLRLSARLETATADSVPVLRVAFTENGREWEATYLIHSDLDNDARLTGYVYRRDGKTTQPGLEALFIQKKR
ncbi:MAG TPA: hypothetical protein ENJ89_08990 [Caldithrix abyssi]|uniref:DUF4426 domain-containing protein n=1 Tax=Caldithrix abyssi TaxID=187145 RepID=A0A7V5PQB4_CALAY|nr:hypothetical protein [Caldithrix abyssi]